jgi:voltage-gated potassium channel Kch
VATQRSRTPADSVLMGLAVSNSAPVEAEVLPADDAACDLVLARSAPPAPPRPPRPRRTVTALSILFSARLRLVLAVLLAVFVVGTAVLAWVEGDLVGAAYVTVISELTGANASPDAGAVEKVTLTLLTVVSIALIPALTAALVDATVKARLRSERGDVPADLDNHVVVVGLGNVGTRVVRDLHNRGVDVVAIERDGGVSGVQAVRELGIPVIVGDASREEVLAAAQVATSRALVVVSTDDVTNLEISLLGRAAKPDLRVVLRLFDAEFARRVHRAFAINLSRSVSYLAAPAFAAAMLGRQVVATIPVRRRVLLVAELPVRAGSRLENDTVAAVNRVGEARLLAIRTGWDDQVLWLPPAGRRLVRTDSLIVVATRAGFGRLLSDTRTVAVDNPTPGRLLEPWLTPSLAPEPRSGPDPAPSVADESPEIPPYGPTDTGSTRPA